ncbi:hypothetical protein [Haloferax sp. YSSS75]|uniref:hypothetical protein n=1 Tax=Haloferax sp. YSSS75 TaxID=3388564 RepID=UPI00398D572F
MSSDKFSVPLDWGSTKTIECPACNSLQVTEILSGLDPVCDDCGAVISEDIEHSAVPDRVDDDLLEIPWEEYCRVSNSTEQQVAIALAVLEEVADELSLGDSVREKAANLYAKAAIENHTDGRSTELVVSVLVALAARELGDPRPTSRIAEAAHVPTSSVRRLIRRLARELNRPAVACSPVEYLPYLREQLDLNIQHERDARELIISVEESQFSGKSPVGVAGAGLYLAANGEVTQREVATVAGLTEETLRVRVRDIRLDTEWKTR